MSLHPEITALPTAVGPDAAKKAAGLAAAALVTDGMRVGLGTGSTAAFALEELGRRVRDEGLRMLGVPTSFSAERLARAHGVPLATLDDLGLDRLAPEKPALDLALDGADEVDLPLNCIKGRGAAHTREKVVASLAARFVVLVDPAKRVERLGTRAPLPVEVVPMALPAVARALRALGAEPVLREGKGKDGPVVTDQGFFLLDARFPDGLDDAERLDVLIKKIPGVLDHGLFVGLATDLLVGHPDGRVEHVRREG